jgi:hypothetical protein
MLSPSITQSGGHAKVHTAPPGRTILALPLTQGCAVLALGYYRWLPPGADQ